MRDGDEWGDEWWNSGGEDCESGCEYGGGDDDAGEYGDIDDDVGDDCDSRNSDDVSDCGELVWWGECGGELVW